MKQSLVRIEVVFLSVDEQIADMETADREEKNLDGRTPEQKFKEDVKWYLNRETVDSYIYVDPCDVSLVVNLEEGNYCRFVVAKTKDAYFAPISGDDFVKKYLNQ